MAHDFLSDDWLDAVEALRDEAPEIDGPAADLVINIIVTETPFDEDREAHLDGGNFERGHADGAKTTISVPYDVAKQLFIEQNQQAAMQAFMSGKIKVQGDMSAMMAMQAGGGPTPEQEAFSAKIQSLTN